MANKKVKVEVFCPQCGDVWEFEVPRELLGSRDHRGVGRLDVNTYFYEGERSNPHFVNCPECKKTFVVRGVKNFSEEPKGIEFCNECGKFIDPKICNGDNLCPECEG